MSLSLDQQHTLRAEVRKHVDSIGCIYPSVGAAMFEEAAQRLAERISHRMIEPLYEAAGAAERAFESLIAQGVATSDQVAVPVATALSTLRAATRSMLGAESRLGLVGPPPDIQACFPRREITDDEAATLPRLYGPLAETVAASEELCKNLLASCPELTSGKPLVEVQDVPADHVPHRYHMVVSHNGHPLVLLDTSEFSLPSDVLNWYAKKYAFDRAKLTYTYVDQIHVPRDRQGRPIENPDPCFAAEHPPEP